MSLPPPRPGVGSIVWTDLAVPDADRVRDFYAAVVGWTHSPVDMGGYSDHCMNEPASGKTVAGVCHARGVNARLPPAWIVYIAVDNLAESLRRVKDLGGEVIDGPRDMGPCRFAAIRDPAGAVCGLIEQ